MVVCISANDPQCLHLPLSGIWFVGLDKFFPKDTHSSDMFKHPLVWSAMMRYIFADLNWVTASGSFNGFLCVNFLSNQDVHFFEFKLSID